MGLVGALSTAVLATERIGGLYMLHTDSIRFEEITRVQDAYWKMRSKDAHHTINP
jgi:hypothetical protein